MFRRILVTLDGSEFAEAALPTAVELVRRSGGELRLLSVHDSGWTAVDGPWGGPAEKARRYLEHQRERLAELHAQVTTVVRAGLVADEVLTEAEDCGADLIVMATHGRGPISRFWLGSVASQCVRRAHRPVLLVRPHRIDAGGEPRAPEPTSRILVPLDGSEFAERALAPAHTLAAQLGRPITLMRAVTEHMAPVSGMIPATYVLNAEMVAEERIEAAAYLDRIADRLKNGRRPPARVVVADEIPKAILEAAGGDLIVMSTHARRGLNRAFLGSVADAVVRSAAGPVLLIPPEPETHRRGEAGGAPRL